FPHGGIARLEHRVELGQQFRRILSPSLRIAETRIDEPVLALERASELLELVLLHDAERKVTAVGRHEDSRRRLPAVADVAGSLERPARHEIRHDGRGHERDRGVEHRDIEILAVAASVTAGQRGYDRWRGCLPLQRVYDAKAVAHRRSSRHDSETY